MIGGISNEQQASDQAAVLARISSGASVSSACGIDQGFLDLCYAVGSNAYREKDYTTAYRAFLFLCLNGHKNSDYWTALASVFAIQGQPFRALPLLETAWQLFPSPENAYRFAESCIRCHEKQAARELLTAALEDLDRAKLRTPLRARIAAALKSLGNNSG